MVLPSSGSAGYGLHNQRKSCCLSRVTLLPLQIKTAREPPGVLSVVEEISLPNKYSEHWYVSAICKGQNTQEVFICMGQTPV